MIPLKIIAHIQNDFPTKFGIPRQSNLVSELRSTIVFEPEYRNPDAFRGLDAYSYIWLIWGFSETERERWSPTVRPPRLGGNTRIGVFATRSPYRPNALGLSSVQLHQVEFHPEQGPLLHIGGADLMNGTPIYDIKPYLPFTDSHPHAASSFANNSPEQQLQVNIAEHLLRQLPPGTAETLCNLLAHDPRPSYHHDPDRIYGMEFAGYEVRFSVNEKVLTVLEVIRSDRA